MSAWHVIRGFRGDKAMRALPLAAAERSAVLPLLLLLVLSACAPGPGAAPVRQEGAVAPAAAPVAMPQRTVVVIVRGEPPSLAARPLVPFSGSLDPPKRVFNGMLDHVDGKRGVAPISGRGAPAAQHGHLARVP